MTENTERGRELYYLIEDVIKYSFEKTDLKIDLLTSTVIYQKKFIAK